ncbi:MAG: hypothetical protein ACE5FQ_01380 [Thiogranum sp.]
MEVILASCGNPDHFQDPDQPMYGCENNSRLAVNSLEEASLKCKDFINRNYLGSGNWAGGEVFEGNKCIAKISYNGNIIHIREN